MNKKSNKSDIMNKVLLNSDIKPFTTECSRCYEKITFTKEQSVVYIVFTV